MINYGLEEKRGKMEKSNRVIQTGQYALILGAECSQQAAGLYCSPFSSSLC